MLYYVYYYNTFIILNREFRIPMDNMYISFNCSWKLFTSDDIGWEKRLDKPEDRPVVVKKGQRLAWTP